MKNTNKTSSKHENTSKPTPAQSRVSNLQEGTNPNRKNVSSIGAQSNKNKNYLELPNEEFLIRNLRLLDVSEQQFLKETKLSLSDLQKLFPKSLVNPTASKQFFFISFVCIQNICCKDEEQVAPLAMWYPPRTVNEQLEFKKALFKVIQNLQILCKIPKNLLVSKGTIMGDSSSATLVQFLRILSELALRAQYLQKYSKRERLIQISCGIVQPNKPDNDINRFYVHPFVPNSMQPPTYVNLQAMKSTYKNYIKVYLRRLTQLRTTSINQEDKFHSEHQNAMKILMQQKQLNQTLSEKIPKKLLSENRAFDRRRIIDRNQQIWQELSKIDCNYVQKSSVPVLQIEGQIDAILKKWEPVKGISNIIQANSLMNDHYAKLRKLTDKNLKEFQKVKEEVGMALSQFKEWE